MAVDTWHGSDLGCLEVSVLAGEVQGGATVDAVGDGQVELAGPSLLDAPPQERHLTPDKCMTTQQQHST